MPLIHVLAVLVVIGLLVYLAIKYIPMPKLWRRIVVTVAIIVTVIWLMQAFGILDLAKDVKVPQVK